MGLFFTDYKPDIVQCAMRYSKIYQEKNKNDRLEEKAAAIRLFSHISDFIKEIPDGELRKAVRDSRSGVEEATLNILHNMFLFYISEAVNMNGDTFITTAIKAYRFINDIKLDNHTIDRAQHKDNDELLYSIVPFAVLRKVEDETDDYENLSDVTKPVIESSRKPEYQEVNEFTLDEFKEYEGEEGLNLASVKELFSGEGNYIGRYHRFVMSPDYVIKKNNEYELHGMYVSPPRDAYYELNTFKSEDKYISMDVIVKCGCNKLVYDEYDKLVICGIVDSSLNDDNGLMFNALSVKPAAATDIYYGENGFSPNIETDSSGVVAKLIYVDFYDDTIRLYLSIKNTRPVKIEIFPNVSTTIVQNGKTYDYDNNESESDFMYPTWPEEILPGEEISGYILLDGPNRTDSFSIRIPFYAEGARFPGRIIIPCERNDVKPNPVRDELNNVKAFINNRFEKTFVNDCDWNDEGALISPNEVAFSLLREDINAGLCKRYESMPGIPTLLKQQAGELINALYMFLTDHYEKYLVGKDTGYALELIHRMLFQDCAYAGMAAIALLKSSPSKLQDIGLAAMLKGDGDYYDMEDIICSLEGIDLTSEKGSRVDNGIIGKTEYDYYHMIVEKHKHNGKKALAAEQLVSFCMGLYCYGIALQMSALSNDSKTI